MERHVELARAHRPKQPAAPRRPDGAQAPTQDGLCAGAAAQLAAVHRVLRHGPVLQLQPGGAAVPNRTGLPDRLKTGVEALSGLSLDDVRVHYNSAGPAELQAHAYTQGTDIHVAPGQERHLAHEAWHAVQQKQGRVRPTRQMKDAAINDDAGLEREADVMGERALAGAPQLRSADDPILLLAEARAAPTLQAKAAMKKRVTQKGNLKKVRKMLAAALPNRRATVEEIAAHDKAQNAGQHHANRNVTLNQLIGDLDTTLGNLTTQNETDSDALGAEQKAGRGDGDVATQLKRGWKA